MGRKGIYIGRQLLLWIIALQVLNLSVGSAFSWDNAYDYSYTYDKSYDPTETAVEWIIELQYGQQPAFSYDAHEDAGKCLMKTFHWKTDLQPGMPAPVVLPLVNKPHGECSVHPLVAHAAETVSPPPERPVV
jgi:hypothetical protein